MPRIPTVDPQQVTDKAKELLDGVQKRLGMTPNFMRTMANAPAALDAFLKFGNALGSGVLSAKTRQQIALTVAQANSCDYCLSAHSAVGKRVGLTPEQIHDARTGSAVDAKSNAVLRFATQLVEKRGFVSDASISAARDAGINDAELAEIVANTAYNLFSNYFNHVAETEVDLPRVAPLEVTAVADGCSTGTCS